MVSFGDVFTPFLDFVHSFQFLFTHFVKLSEEKEKPLFGSFMKQTPRFKVPRSQG